MKPFITRWLVTTLAVFFATILPGIHADSIGSLIEAGLLLGILNAVVRPIILVLSLPLILVTMGFFIFIVNALTLKLVSGLIPGFHVHGFGSALLGSMLISFVSWLLNVFIKGGDISVRVSGSVSRTGQPGASGGSGMKSVTGRVIEDEEA